MNFKIRTKILVAFLLVISIGVMSIVINFILLNSLIQKYHHFINIVDPAQSAVFDLKNSFNDDIRAIEKYGNGLADLDETERIVEAAEAKIDSAIKKIESSDLENQEHIQSLRNILENDEIADEKVFEIKKSEKNNPAQQMISFDLQQALISFDLVNNEVDKTIEEMTDDLQRHKTEDIKEFENSIHQSRLYIITAFAVSILISLLLAFITSFGLSSSIKKVRDAALKMSVGNLAQRVSISAKDEVGELANAFNQMAENIEKSQSDLKKIEEELRERVEEAEKLNRLMVDRDLKMVELKQEVESYKEQIAGKVKKT